MAEKNFRLGIDLGCTKKEIIILGSLGREIHRRRVAAGRGHFTFHLLGRKAVDHV